MSKETQKPLRKDKRSFTQRRNSSLLKFGEVAVESLLLATSVGARLESNHSASICWMNLKIGTPRTWCKIYLRSSPQPEQPNFYWWFKLIYGISLFWYTGSIHAFLPWWTIAIMLASKLGFWWRHRGICYIFRVFCRWGIFFCSHSRSPFILIRLWL